MDLDLTTCGGLSSCTMHGSLSRDRGLRGDGDLLVDPLRLHVYRLGDGDLERPRTMCYGGIRSG